MEWYVAALVWTAPFTAIGVIQAIRAVRFVAQVGSANADR